MEYTVITPSLKLKDSQRFRFLADIKMLFYIKKLYGPTDIIYP